MASAESRVLVYDVGGSHISAAVFHREGNKVDGVVSAGYAPEQTTEAFLGVLHSLGTRATDGRPDVAGAALAMPGPFDYENGVSWMTHKLPYLYGFDLRHALACRMSLAPVRVRFLNDAAAHLAGELTAGAAQGVRRAVSITLGTGVGSAFAVDGLVVREGPGVPSGGEIWNLLYQGGILEDRISTRAIQKSYRERTGQEREVAAIAAAASTEPAAAEVFNKFGHDLGVALRTVLSSFAPDVIVIGGGIAKSAYLFLSAGQDELSNLGAQLRISVLGDQAPLVGAGAAWFQHEGSLSVPTAIPE